MNFNERPLLARLQDCLNTMTGLGPTNPCDLKAVLQAYDVYRAATRELFLAMTCIGFGDYTDAAERLQNAERVLGRKASETLTTPPAKPAGRGEGMG